MGNATSSALRAEDTMTPAPARADDGPAFGSLANLGGPRKFKKKPVLVLDPEELEKAHMMFQEASAEMLGEEAPKHEKGASVLGLAPMDDEDATPEDMGASDDVEAGEDDEAIPSAEEVLRMTEARAAIDPDMAAAQDDYIAQQLESLDVEHRIFPSLPLKSEDEIDAEEEAERAAAQAAAESEESTDASAMDATPAPRIDFTAEDELASPYVGPFENLRSGTDMEADGPYEQAHDAPPAPAFPVNPLPEPEAELEPLPEPEPEAELEPLPEPAPLVAGTTAASVFGDEPFLDFPTQPLSYAPEPEAATESEPDMAASMAPEPVDEFQPEAEFEAEPVVEMEDPVETAAPAEPDLPQDEPFETETYVEEQVEAETYAEESVAREPEPEPEAAYELDLADEIDWDRDAPLGLGPDYEPKPEPEPEAEGNYTEIDDEPVDGYAFMYASNPRARTLHALAEGESNSLRAKLLKKREEAMAELKLAERQPSVWTRFTAWLRSLLG